jgi:hypothetical protein
MNSWLQWHVMFNAELPPPVTETKFRLVWVISEGVNYLIWPSYLPILGRWLVHVTELASKPEKATLLVWYFVQGTLQSEEGSSYMWPSCLFKLVVFESSLRDIIGVTWMYSRTGCISNRGRKHFELNRVTPQCYRGTWSGCVFRAGCVSNWGRQHFEFIWFELNQVTPQCYRGIWSRCVFWISCVSNQGRQHFELIWFELNRVTPQCYRGTWSGCVFQASCFSNRGRLHFELIRFELNRVTPQCFRGTWSGCVFRVGCVSNRGGFLPVWFVVRVFSPYGFLPCIYIE